MSEGADLARLSQLWQERWPLSPPIAHEVRAVCRDRWVRFHSLPGSKRYADDEEDEVYVVTAGWSAEPTGPEEPTPRNDVHPGSVRWTTVADTDDPDPQFHTYTHLYVNRRPWQRGCVDPLLRTVADDELAGVFLTDTALRRIHHPYDGGADVLLPTPQERDQLATRHPDWLSSHPLGL